MSIDPKSLLDSIGSEAPPSREGRGTALAVVVEKTNRDKFVLGAGFHTTMPKRAPVEKIAEGRSRQDEKGPAAAFAMFYNFCCGIEHQGQKPDPLFADRIAWVQICGDPKRINAKPPKVSLCSLTPLLDYINKKIPTPLHFLRFAYEDVVGGRPANGEVSYAAGIAKREDLAALHRLENQENFGHNNSVPMGLQARSRHIKLTEERAKKAEIANHLPPSKLVDVASKRTGMQPLYKSVEGMSGAVEASADERKIIQGGEKGSSKSQRSGTTTPSFA